MNQRVHFSNDDDLLLHSRHEADISSSLTTSTALQSLYQPIISPALQRMVGMEAQLLLQGSGRGVLPDSCMADIDPLALVTHARNVPPTERGNEWLFLPLQPQSIRQRLLSPELFLRELDARGIPPSRIMLQITESEKLGDSDMADFVAMFRECGFGIAIDDFGAGTSNYERILILCPDVVRLDPALIQNAEGSRRAARLFPHMVTLLREAGSMVLVNGITTEAQARIAIDADAELLQGSWFAPASARLPEASLIQEKAALLMTAGKSVVDRTELRMRSRFMAIWNAYRDGRELVDIVQEIPDEEVTRVYVIDSRGYQIGDTELTRHALRGRQHPLADARGACWARRQYFRNALEQPGRVQITRPYLSLTEQRLCMTFSCVVMRPGLGQVVLCMDALLLG